MQRYKGEIKLPSEMFKYDESSPSGLVGITDVYGGDQYQCLKRKAGDIAGSLNRKDGYWRVRLNGRSWLCHKLVWELHGKTIPKGMMLDHEDGNRGNNKISNLRCVTRSFNNQNAKKRRDNATGVTGVTFHTNFDRKGNPYTYCMARWKEGGKDRMKSFSIDKLGIMVAFRNACQYREQQIARLNAEGAGYTERHGN